MLSDDATELIRIIATNAWKSEFTYDSKMRCRIREEFTTTRKSSQ